LFKVLNTKTFPNVTKDVKFIIHNQTNSVVDASP